MPKEDDSTGPILFIKVSVLVLTFVNPQEADNKSKLDIVTIALEKKGDNWRKVTQKFGFNWDFQAVSYNKFVLSSSIANKYGVLDLPSKFLINPKGYIVLSKTTFEEIESYLDNIEI